MRPIVYALAVLWPCSAIAADFDWAAYKPSTIPEILDRHRTIECRPTAAREYVFSAHAFKYQITTAYSQHIRPISEDTNAFLRHYAKSFRWNERVMERYKQELLVNDGRKQYWIPIQDPLLPALDKELTKGQQFALYIAVLGATNNRCVFVATEFSATPR